VNKKLTQNLLIFALLIFYSNTALAQTPFLTFPLPKRTKDTAVINSIFDHSMAQAYCPDNVIVAYTEEEGRREFGASTSFVNFGCGILQGFKNSSGSNFVVNGNYSGGEPQFLFYDGHPGHDYKTIDQNPTGKINVLAAAPGTVGCVSLKISNGADMDRIENGSGLYACTEGRKKGEIKIDHGNGYFTIYLHLSTAKVHAGDMVKRGQKIALSGETGSPGAPHLHFEVRKNIDGILVPVDPYGWEGHGVDPYTSAVNVNLWADPVNVYFLVDLSKSFADDLPVFQAQAPAIISVLKASNPTLRMHEELGLIE
jgi:hypothetical protein